MSARPEETSVAWRVRVPRLIAKEEQGLGEFLKRLTSAVGIHFCGGCQRRAEILNSRVVLFSSSSPPPPLPGCWYAGSTCTGFIQTLKYCCGDWKEYTERWGWCIGLWFAPPCRF